MDGAVPFDRLASWIERQANIARSEATQVSSTVLSSQPVGTANVAPVPQTSSTSVVPLQNTSPAIRNVAPSQTNTQPASSQNQGAWNRGRVWCVACKVNGHPTYACETLSQDEFQSLDPQAQRNRVKGECFICLGRLKHNMRDCSDKGPACRSCRQRHDPRLKCNPPKQDSSPSSGGRSLRSSNAA